MAKEEIIHIVEAADRSSLPDLVATVRQLANHLGGPRRRGAAAGTGQFDVVDDALAVAREAEQRLAEQMARIARLERLAHTDELTGLLNRRGFLEEVQRNLGAARRYGESGLLIFIDLDGFKQINDTYGHAAGDEVLRQIGRWLIENVRNTDYVARLGGDEFAVLLTRTGVADGQRRARALEHLVNSSVVAWNGRLIAPHASFGTQAYGATDDEGELLHRADEAMYLVKRGRVDTTERRAIA